MFHRCRSLVVVVGLMSACGGCGTFDHTLRTEVPSPPRQDAVVKVEVVIPTFFPPLERHFIEEGVYEWTTAMNGAVEVQYAKDPDLRLASHALESLAMGWNKEVPSILYSHRPRKLWDPDLTCNNTLVFLRTLSTDDVITKKGRTGWLGWSSSTCHVKYVALVVDKLGTPDRFQNTVAHEFGHAIGMDHEPTPRVSIMFPYSGGETKCVSWLDRKNFCTLWGCNVNNTRKPVNCTE